MKILLFLCTLVLFLSSLVAAQDISCNYCNKQISEGDYVIVSGKFFHEDHFICNVCQKPIGDSYIEAENGYMHRDCFAEHMAPKCAHCSLPILTEAMLFANNKYHKTCYRDFIGGRCALCDQAIEGEFLKDVWGNHYHAYHKNSATLCDYCGRYISEKLTRGGKIRGEKFPICGLCLPGAVSSLTEAKKLLDEIQSRLEKEGITFQKPQVELHLVSFEELRNVFPGVLYDHRGFTSGHYYEVNGRRQNSYFEIYIITDMPRLHYISTAAHELMHVWLSSQELDNLDAPLREGSCNYAAALVLQQYEDAMAKYILESLDRHEDPIYGEGYRQVKTYVQKNGKDAWLKMLQGLRPSQNGR